MISIPVSSILIRNTRCYSNSSLSWICIKTELKKAISFSYFSLLSFTLLLEMTHRAFFVEIFINFFWIVREIPPSNVNLSALLSKFNITYLTLLWSVRIIGTLSCLIPSALSHTPFLSAWILKSYRHSLIVSAIIFFSQQDVAYLLKSMKNQEYHWLCLLVVYNLI